MNATAQSETIIANAEKFMDWAISSQALQECREGSTTSVWSPVRTVKRHECGAVMYKQVIGVYAIFHAKAGIVYYGSSKCVTGRLNAHRRELRNRIHKNAFLQHAWNKYGEELQFKLIEECELSELRRREQWYIDNAQDRLMNMEKEVCEIASSETHSLRMANAWKNRSEEAKQSISEKISNTVKSKYADDSKYLDSARKNLEKGRKKLAESGYFENGLKLAQQKSGVVMKALWADPEQRKIRAESIARGMRRVEKKCQFCGIDFVSTLQAKFCRPACRSAAFDERRKAHC